jgi:ABC-type branched-subunit amino acid transport system ATPase component
VSEELLRAEGVCAGYGSGDIVKGVDARVCAGELVVLLGPNGAGKSTFLKALVGLIRISNGRVILRGVDRTGWATERLVRDGLAYVPQLSGVFPSLSVIENLEMGAYFRRSGVRERIGELLELFPALRAAAKRPAGTLSGGERSLLALARGLMVKPSVLLTDEPTAGLSPAYQRVVWDHLSLVRDSGVAVLVVEQNVSQALRFADRGYVLVLGTTAMEGTSDELRASDLGALYIGGQRPTTSQPSFEQVP